PWSLFVGTYGSPPSVVILGAPSWTPNRILSGEAARARCYPRSQTLPQAGRTRAGGEGAESGRARPKSLTAWVRQRREQRFDLGPQVLEIGRQREALAQVLGRLVCGESWSDRGDLEENAARLAGGEGIGGEGGG